MLLYLALPLKHDFENGALILFLLSLKGRVYPPEYEGHFDRLCVTREEVLERTKVIAKLIHDDYAGRRPVMLCVLKGASPVRSFCWHLSSQYSLAFRSHVTTGSKPQTFLTSLFGFQCLCLSLLIVLSTFVGGVTGCKTWLFNGIYASVIV